MFNFLLKKKKKTDVLLIFCPVWHPGFPNVGLGAIDIFLRKHGIATEILDLNIETYKNAPFQARHFWDDRESYYWMRDDLITNTIVQTKINVTTLVNKILEFDAPVIAFSVNMANQKITETLTKLVKQKSPEKKIIWGGPNYANELDPGRPDYSIVDAAVIGEGEIPFIELLFLYRDGELPTHIRKEAICLNNSHVLQDEKNRIYGAQYVFNKTMFLYTPGRYIIDINKVPYPDYKGFPINKYIGQSFSFMVTRGCIFKCKFCCDHIRGLQYRYRNPESIINEISNAVKNFKKKNFVFHDSAINSKMEMLINMCELLIKHKLNKPWSCLAFPIKKMKPEVLHLMKEAGCYQISYGLESGSNQVLKLMGKPFNLETAEEVIKNTHNTGIQAKFNIITGFPGETEENHKESLEFIKRNRNYIYAIGALNTCDVLAGSILWENRYSIFTKYVEEESSFWELNDLTLDVRKKRFKEIVELTHQLNIKIEIYNQPEIYDAVINNSKTNI